MRRTGKKTYEKKALDKLAREVTFARDGGRCIRCASRAGLQWCHAHSRRYLSTRWRLENLMTLCAGCHLFWHHRPLEASGWFLREFPYRAGVLDRMKVFPQKVDLKLERLYLMAEAKKLGVVP